MRIIYLFVNYQVLFASKMEKAYLISLIKKLKSGEEIDYQDAFFLNFYVKCRYFLNDNSNRETNILSFFTKRNPKGLYLCESERFSNKYPLIYKMLLSKKALC